MDGDNPICSMSASNVRSSTIRDFLNDANLPGMISLAGGLPNRELFDVSGIKTACNTVLHRHPEAALQYGATEGQASLRRELVSLMAHRGIDTTADTIVVTTGSQQAIDLVARALLNPGDIVALERPSYLAAIQAFTLAGAKFWTMPSDADGVLTDRLPNFRTGDRRPKLAYLVTNFSNPSGTTLPLARRKALLAWAVENKVFILEDDPYGELRFRGHRIPALITLAAEIPGAERWCGYASSLSKIVAPGLRVGWLVLPNKLSDTVVRVKQALDLHTSSFVQEIAAEYLASSALSDRINLARERYRQHSDALVDALDNHLHAELTWNTPEGGMFVWATFKHNGDTSTLLPIARKEGVVFVPGIAFDPMTESRNSMRLSFATAGPAQLTEGICRLARAISEWRMQT
jgi:2-aminoadipate transaminase